MNRLTIWLRYSLAIAVVLLSTQHLLGSQTVAILLDDSGSMNDRMRSDRRVVKIEAAKLALQSVLSQLSEDDVVGVLALNSRGAEDPWVIPLGALDRRQVQDSVNQISAGGGTPLGMGMKVAADALLARRGQAPYNDYRLLIVTDGEAQDPDLVDRFLPRIRSRNLTVDVIGVSMAQEHSLAQRVDSYRRADDMDSLTTAIQEALAETPIDPQNPNQLADDFELLAGLPDEVAVAAIAALTANDNRPIGEAAVETGDYESGGNSTATNPNSSSPNAGGGTGQSDSFGFRTVLVLMFVVFAIASMMKSGGKRR